MQTNKYIFIKDELSMTVWPVLQWEKEVVPHLEIYCLHVSQQQLEPEQRNLASD